MNDPLRHAAMQRRNDQFLDRVRRTGQQSMVAIAEAVTESVRRIGQRPDDPAAAMADAVLPSLRVIEQEARRAIARVEALTEEWQQHGSEHVVIVAGPGSAARGESVLSRRDPFAANDRLSGHRSEQPQPPRTEDLPEGA